MFKIVQVNKCNYHHEFSWLFQELFQIEYQQQSFFFNFLNFRNWINNKAHSAQVYVSVNNQKVN